MSHHNASRSRRMVSLGKVTAPKPVNLPSQKKEQNNLMDVGAMFGGGSSLQSWGGMSSGGAQDHGSANEQGNGKDHDAHEHEHHGHQMKNVQRVIPAQAQPAWGGAGLPEERVRALELASREQFPTLGTEVDDGAKKERGGEMTGGGGRDGGGYGEGREGYHGERDGGYYGDSREGYYRGHHRGGYGGGNSYYQDDKEGGRYGGGRYGRRGGYGGFDERGYEERGYEERGYEDRGYEERGYDERSHGGHDQYRQFSHEGGEGGEGQDVRESHGFQDERIRMGVMPPYEHGDRFGDRFDPRENYDRRHGGPQSPRYGRGYGRERPGYGGGPRNPMNDDMLSSRGGYGRDDFYGRHGGRGGYGGAGRRRDDPRRGPYNYEEDIGAPEAELNVHRNGRIPDQAKVEGPKVPPPPPPRRAAAGPPPPPPGRATGSREGATLEPPHADVDENTTAEEHGDSGVQVPGVAQVPTHPKVPKGPVKVLKREPESLSLDIDLGTQISRPASRAEGSVDSFASIGHTSPVLPSLEDLSIGHPMAFGDDNAAAFDTSGPPGLFTSMVASEVGGHELHFPVADVDHDAIHHADVKHHAESVAQLLDGFDDHNPGNVSDRQVTPATLNGQGDKVSNHLPNIHFGDIVLPSIIDGCVPDSQSQSPHHKEFYGGRGRGRGGRGRGEPTSRGRGRGERGRGRGRGARGDRGRGGGRGGRGRGEPVNPINGGAVVNAPKAPNAAASPSAQGTHPVTNVPPPPPPSTTVGKISGPSGTAASAGPKKQKPKKPRKKFETKGEPGPKGPPTVGNGPASSGPAEQTNINGKAAKSKEVKGSKTAPSPKGDKREKSMGEGPPPRTPAPPAVTVSTGEK